jgi:hypothetical protein
MRDRSGASPTKHTPHTWTDLTYADAVADCPTHRAQYEQAEARHAEFSAANGKSIARRDRIQLGLRVARQAVASA